jgi:phosphoribosyl-AMP cyclohydrolase
MNPEARRLTEETGLVHFWSRSRQKLWQKGEESGNVLRLVEIRSDCDDDALLVLARPAGPTCHTGPTPAGTSRSTPGSPDSNGCGR